MSNNFEETEEMSMEEILASIRKYVSDDSHAAINHSLKTSADHQHPKKYDDDVLVLTDEFIETNMTKAPEFQNNSTTESAFDTKRWNNQDLPSEPSRGTNDLNFSDDSFVKPIPSPREEIPTKTEVSGKTLSDTANAFSRLAEISKNPTQQNNQASSSTITLDHLISELARPMIKQWLDTHLTLLVETLVSKEIEKITKSH